MLPWCELINPLGFSQGMLAVMLAMGMGVGGLVSRWELRSRTDLMKASALIVLCLAVGGASKIAGSGHAMTVR